VTSAREGGSKPASKREGEVTVATRAHLEFGAPATPMEICGIPTAALWHPESSAMASAGMAPSEANDLAIILSVVKVCAGDNRVCAECVKDGVGVVGVNRWAGGQGMVRVYHTRDNRPELRLELSPHSPSPRQVQGIGFLC
jgi:hypothetical protein